MFRIYLKSLLLQFSNQGVVTMFKGILLLTTIISLLISMEVLSMSHSYKLGESTFDGIFLPTPQNKKAPGIVLIHNWMGVTQETKKQAQRFQKLGYNVFAADIYGAGIRPKSPKEAGELAGKYKGDRKLLRDRIKLAIDELKKQKNVDSTNIVVIGYCFGGTAAIEAARSGENLKGVVSFHGGLDSPTPEDGAQIKARVLVLHGAVDPYISAKDMEAFEKEMQTYKVDYELIKYGGTVHSFTDTGAGSDLSKGAAYNAESDKKSFARTKDFLSEVFQ